MISWVFYDINTNYDHNGKLGIFSWINAFSFVGQIWMYQTLATIVFNVVITGTIGYIGAIIFFFYEEYVNYTGKYGNYNTRYGDYRNRPRCCMIFNQLIIWVLITIAGIIGTFLIPIVLEILNYIIPAVILYFSIDSKIPNNYTSSNYLWSNIIHFVLKSKSRKDRLLRVISANRILLDKRSVGQYLIDKQTEYESKNIHPFSDVAFNDLIIHSPNVSMGLLI